MNYTLHYFLFIFSIYSDFSFNKNIDIEKCAGQLSISIMKIHILFEIFKYTEKK